MCAPPCTHGPLPRPPVHPPPSRPLINTPPPPPDSPQYIFALQSKIEFGGVTLYDCGTNRAFNPKDPWNYVASGQCTPVADTQARRAACLLPVCLSECLYVSLSF